MAGSFSAFNTNLSYTNESNEKKLDKESNEKKLDNESINSKDLNQLTKSNQLADKSNKPTNLNDKSNVSNTLSTNTNFNNLSIHLKDKNKWLFKLNLEFKDKLINLLNEYSKILISDKKILINKKELIESKINLIKSLTKTPLKLEKESNSSKFIISLDNNFKYTIIDQLINNENFVIDFQDTIDTEFKNKLIEENKILINRLNNLPIEFINSNVSLVDDQNDESQYNDDMSNQLEMDFANLKNNIFNCLKRKSNDDSTKELGENKSITLSNIKKYKANQKPEKPKETNSLADTSKYTFNKLEFKKLLCKETNKSKQDKSTNSTLKFSTDKQTSNGIDFIPPTNISYPTFGFGTNPAGTNKIIQESNLFNFGTHSTAIGSDIFSKSIITFNEFGKKKSSTNTTALKNENSNFIFGKTPSTNTTALKNENSNFIFGKTPSTNTTAIKNENSNFIFGKTPSNMGKLFHFSTETTSLEQPVVNSNEQGRQIKKAKRRLESID